MVCPTEGLTKNGSPQVCDFNKATATGTPGFLWWWGHMFEHDAMGGHVRRGNSSKRVVFRMTRHKGDPPRACGGFGLRMSTFGLSRIHDLANATNNCLYPREARVIPLRLILSLIRDEAYPRHARDDVNKARPQGMRLSPTGGQGYSPALGAGSDAASIACIRATHGMSTGTDLHVENAQVRLPPHVIDSVPAFFHATQLHNMTPILLDDILRWCE